MMSELVILELCKLQDGKFLRTAAACPEPIFLLTSNQQLDDLVHFCSDPKQFSVLTVDPTFSLGDFSVTCISYRNVLVKGHTN